VFLLLRLQVVLGYSLKWLAYLYVQHHTIQAGGKVLPRAINVTPSGIKLLAPSGAPPAVSTAIKGTASGKIVSSKYRRAVEEAGVAGGGVREWGVAVCVWGGGVREWGVGVCVCGGGGRSREWPVGVCVWGGGMGGKGGRLRGKVLPRAISVIPSGINLMQAARTIWSTSRCLNSN
jgi:hypothetical protein